MWKCWSSFGRALSKFGAVWNKVRREQNRQVEKNTCRFKSCLRPENNKKWYARGKIPKGELLQLTKQSKIYSGTSVHWITRNDKYLGKENEGWMYFNIHLMAWGLGALGFGKGGIVICFVGFFFSNLMQFTYVMDLLLYSVISLRANTYITSHSGHHVFHILTLCLFNSRMHILFLLNRSKENSGMYFCDCITWINCKHPVSIRALKLHSKWICMWSKAGPGSPKFLHCSPSSSDDSLHDFG